MELLQNADTNFPLREQKDFLKLKEHKFQTVNMTKLILFMGIARCQQKQGSTPDSPQPNQTNQMKKSNIKVFYTPKQVNTNSNIIGITSRSPLKPMLLMRAFNSLPMGNNLDIDSSFAPFTNDDFKIAHTETYVESFFNGVKPLCQSNSLPWSQELADSVRYTNASLYNAVRHSIDNPDQVSFSPTSGFHHARPGSGAGFCTFAGQVIAAIKVYRETGSRGAVLDLDGHYGNSIEDARHFNDEINEAIPMGFNFAQLQGRNLEYIASLKKALAKIEAAVLDNKIQYVLWCHGADSHDKDDLGGQVNTYCWVQAAEIFYAWVAQLDAKLEALGRTSLPVTLSLFGGYRQDSYASVLSLHIKDITLCMNMLCGGNFKYKVNVADKSYGSEKWYDDGGFYVPISLLKMESPKKYMSDAEFLRTKMTKNEEKVLEFLKAHPTSGFTGIELGEKVKGWKNHSMAKWAKALVRRKLIETLRDTRGVYGYKLYPENSETRQERPVAMHI